MPLTIDGAQRASTPRSDGHRRFAFRAVQLRITAIAVLLAVVAVPVQTPAQVEATHTEASRVVANAKHHVGAPWRYGVTGPYAFDCSGLVYHAFASSGLASRIGGKRTADGYYWYFRSLGRTSTSGPRVGDLVAYAYSGRRVSHIGIYIGNGYTVSTLTSGVRVHRTYAVTTPVRAFLRVSLTR